jgi:hypothetical protein
MNNKDEEKIQELEKKVRKIDNATEMLAACIGGGLFGGVAVSAGLALLPAVIVAGIGGAVGAGVYHLCKMSRKK